MNSVVPPNTALLRTILDAAPCPMLVVNAAGLIEAASAAAERLFGTAAGELAGTEISRCIDASGAASTVLSDRGGRDPLLGKVGSPPPGEMGRLRIAGVGGRIASGLRRNGKRFPLEVTVSEVAPALISDMTGKPLLIVFVRDLTEHQATQARLRELQEDLVHVSRLRAMGQMAAALSHELNQPLTATTNYLNAANRMIEHAEPDLPRIRQAVSLAAQQTMRSGEIIRRLRAFVARGEVVRRPEWIGRIVEEAGALALVDARDHGVSFTLDASPDLPAVLVDRVQIQQVVLNLVRNAIEAMDGMDERVISVAATLWDSMIAVSVCDSGPGISPAIEAQLFQPFVTTKRDGMGIGLSVCRTIVEAHGGRLWAEARDGGGTMFRFTVPLASAEHGEASG